MKLREIRKKIDSIDSKIVKLLNDRAKLALETKDLKQEERLDVYSPSREKKVLDNVKKINQGLLKNESVISIFKEIVSSCLSIQKKIKVAYLGPAFSFTHQAAVNSFGKETKYSNCSSISYIFNEVEKSHSNYGVVPVENSTEGIISHTLDMFIDSDLKICSEILFKITHYLLSNEKKLEDVKKIYSKAEVFGQCRKWLEERMPSVQLCDVQSTSEAAHIVAGESNSAAIASKVAAEEYKLNILAREIQDYKENLTRFLVIAKDFDNKSTGKDKTSIMFSIKDSIGALHDMLVPFKKYNINLTKIESRPSRAKLWEYYFFVDFEGHYKDENVKKALSELGKNCNYLKTLGSYPIG